MGGGNSHGVMGLPCTVPPPSLLPSRKTMDRRDTRSVCHSISFCLAPLQETVTRTKLVVDANNPTNISSECIVFPSEML